jgi:hypothetical protein
METNNKLLAEFINCENPQAWEDVPSLFEYDWNWLMQVVEKIESLNFAIKVVVNEALIFCEDWESLDYIYAREKTKIEAVYNACVEFVKWYNEQK